MSKASDFVTAISTANGDEANIKTILDKAKSESDLDGNEDDLYSDDDSASASVIFNFDDGSSAEYLSYNKTAIELEIDCDDCEAEDDE